MHQARPFWTDSALGLSEETSFGAPSGHAQSATVFLGTLAVRLKRWYVSMGAVVLVLLMALSRLFLGVHFLQDVVLGIIAGALILIVVALLLQRHGRDLTGVMAQFLVKQRVVLFGVLLLLLALGAISFVLARSAIEGSPFSALVEAGTKSGLDDVLAMTAMLLGTSIGFYFEHRRIGMSAAGPLWKRLARLAIGLPVTLVLLMGLGAILPREPMAVAAPLRFLRYFLVAMWWSYGAPLTFVRLKLADKISTTASA